MRADELRSAVVKVVDILAKADLLAVVRDYRAAKGDQRTVAAARLGHAGAVVMEKMDNLSDAENAIVHTLHLDSLGSAKYWQSLLESVNQPQKQAAELVNLYSRVLFASNHLPNLVNTLALASDNNSVQPVADGQKRLTIRLNDAGEKASDPDRVARAIDGMDMLYSACASISKKPAMDLQLDAVTGREHRDAAFTGDAEGVSAVIAVMESIPEALADIDEHQDFDLNDVVNSLPIFNDLKKLAELGTFSESDLNDLSETMHQGVVLTLESGVILLPDESPAPDSRPTGREPIAAPAPVESTPAAAAAAIASGAIATTSAPSNGATAPVSEPTAPAHSDMNGSQPVAPAPQTAGGEPPLLTKRSAQPDTSSGLGRSANGTGESVGSTDEHYERYLREREAMQQGITPAAGLGDGDQERRDAVAELLKTLEQDRNGG